MTKLCRNVCILPEPLSPHYHKRFQNRGVKIMKMRNLCFVVSYALALIGLKPVQVRSDRTYTDYLAPEYPGTVDLISICLKLAQQNRSTETPTSPSVVFLWAPEINNGDRQKNTSRRHFASLYSLTSFKEYLEERHFDPDVIREAATATLK
ncbi:hypothetical protein J6590_002730 [Homalodisca vitripennis]|nr:hypothetical protein J6590_002730 [Homalodisca vitripennis]